MALFLIRNHTKDYISSIEESTKNEKEVEKEVEKEEVDSEEDKDWNDKDISFYQYF